ncbi:MAG: hypothetical protein HRU10_05405 [Opitutales bacterium]|nr:hypothetical protein [Opitutales bacterium]
MNEGLKNENWHDTVEATTEFSDEQLTFLSNKPKRIIIIDDTISVLEDFKSILSAKKSFDQSLAKVSDELFGEEEGSAPEQNQTMSTDESDIVFDVSTAVQGKMGHSLALDAMQKGKPFQVAFVDMRMPPGWDELQTIHAIMQIDANLQCVICTAYSDFTWAETMQELNHERSDRILILKKPFDPSEVWQLAVSLSERWHKEHARKETERSIEHLHDTLRLELESANNRISKFRNILLELKQVVKEEHDLERISIITEQAIKNL